MIFSKHDIFKKLSLFRLFHSNFFTRASHYFVNSCFYFCKHKISCTTQKSIVLHFIVFSFLSIFIFWLFIKNKNPNYTANISRTYLERDWFVLVELGTINAWLNKGILETIGVSLLEAREDGNSKCDDLLTTNISRFSK